jgi:hypothetical protein
MPGDGDSRATVAAGFMLKAVGDFGNFLQGSVCHDCWGLFGFNP